MTLNRALVLTSVALGAMLVIQVALVSYRNSQPPQRRLHASWVQNANTLKEGLDQSDHVILGEVIELRKGPDLVIPAAGEPGGEDRIPTTITKFRVHKTYKGAPGEFVELVQTGHSTDAVLLPGNPFPAPARDDDNDKGKGKSKSQRKVRGQSKSFPTMPTTVDSRATILEDDPPYLAGEKYVLFLKDPQHTPDSAAALAGLSPTTKRVLAPEGRLQITKSDPLKPGTTRLKPATTRRGFAPNWVGRPLTEFETEIAQAH